MHHMTQGFEKVPRGPWWKNLKITPAMGVAVAVLVAGVFFARYLGNANGSPDGTAEGSIRVNLNTATLTELESIPGIGEVLAKQIVAQRPYRSVDQLLQIRGIGPTSLTGLAPYVKVDGETEKLR
jgi:DNA uptake protein ComE-like DNA-binding protein